MEQNQTDYFSLTQIRACNSQALFFLSACFTSYIMEKKPLQFGGIIMFEILVFIGISAIVGIPTYIIIDKFKDKLNSDGYHW